MTQIKDQIKFPDWLKSKGLDPMEAKDINSKYLPEYFKEMGFNPAAINAMQDYTKEKVRKNKEWERKSDDWGKYIALSIAVIILIADSFLNFLSRGLALGLLIITGLGFLSVFIKNTVRKAIKDNKES